MNGLEKLEAWANGSLTQISLDEAARRIARRVWSEMFSIDIPQAKCTAIRQVCERIVYEELKGKELFE